METNNKYEKLTLVKNTLGGVLENDSKLLNDNGYVYATLINVERRTKGRVFFNINDMSIQIPTDFTECYDRKMDSYISKFSDDYENRIKEYFPEEDAPTRMQAICAYICNRVCEELSVEFVGFEVYNRNNWIVITEKHCNIDDKTLEGIEGFRYKYIENDNYNTHSEAYIMPTYGPRIPVACQQQFPYNPYQNCINSFQNPSFNALSRLLSNPYAVFDPYYVARNVHPVNTDSECEDYPGLKESIYRYVQNFFIKGDDNTDGVFIEDAFDEYHELFFPWTTKTKFSKYFRNYVFELFGVSKEEVRQKPDQGDFERLSLFIKGIKHDKEKIKGEEKNDTLTIQDEDSNCDDPHILDHNGNYNTNSTKENILLYVKNFFVEGDDTDGIFISDAFDEYCEFIYPWARHQEFSRYFRETTSELFGASKIMKEKDENGVKKLYPFIRGIKQKGVPDKTNN